MQGRRADGPRERVPRLVRDRTTSSVRPLAAELSRRRSCRATRVRGCARTAREVAREKRRAFRDEVYWGKPVPGFGDPRARVLLVGARAGGARRQPHRPRVHRRRRRRLRRFPDGGAASRRLRQHPDVAASRRRPRAAGRVHRRRGALRAAGQQADAGRNRQLPAASRRRSSPRCRACASIVALGRIAFDAYLQLLKSAASCCAAAGVRSRRPRISFPTVSC